MKFSSTALFDAVTLTCVQAIKPPSIHAGHLTLQDLLALRSGSMLPQIVESEYS